MVVVLYIPSTSQFVCPFVQAKNDFVKAYNAAVNETALSHFDLLEALPSRQLWIEQGTGWPSKGGYLSSFDTVYEVTMTSKNFPIHSNDPNNIIIDAHLISLKELKTIRGKQPIFKKTIKTGVYA